jgi:hypothetical protein
MYINRRERNKQRVSKRIEVQHDGPGLPIVINPNTLEERGAIARAKEEG